MTNNKKTLTQFFNDAVKTEESANQNLSIATLATDRVLLAMVIKASRQAPDSKFLSKKQITELVFNKYKMSKDDAGKSAVYNKISVVYYMLTNNESACLHLKETTTLSDVDLMNHVNEATKQYKDHYSILKAIKDARKTPERKTSPAKEVLKIDSENFTSEEIFTALKSKFLNMNNAESALESILALLDKVEDIESIAKIESACKAKKKAIAKQDKKAA